jgi:hypothetical protein
MGQLFYFSTDGKKAQKNALFWPRAIFTPSHPGIIVTAEAFQDSVREGKSWFHLAQETRTKRFYTVRLFTYLLKYLLR